VAREQGGRERIVRNQRQAPLSQRRSRSFFISRKDAKGCKDFKNPLRSRFALCGLFSSWYFVTFVVKKRKDCVHSVRNLKRLYNRSFYQTADGVRIFESPNSKKQEQKIATTVELGLKKRYNQHGIAKSSWNVIEYIVNQLQNR